MARSVRFFGCAVIVAALCGSGGPAVAANGTWNGGSSGTWDASATNWLNVTGTPWDITNGGTNTAVLNTANATLSVTGAVFTGTISALQSGTLTGSGTITMAGAATPTIFTNTSTTLTINGVLAGSAGLTKTGAGTLILGGNNTIGSGTLSFGGGTATAGYIRLTNGNALGNFTTVALLSDNAGTSGLELAGGITAAYAIRTGGRANAESTGSILRNVSGSNTWNGTISITGGGGLYGIVSDAGLLTIGGTLTSVFNQSPFGPRAFTFAPGGGAITVSGRIVDGTGSANNSLKVVVNKAGTGTLTLSGSNTYTQGTNFTSGTTTSVGILAVSHNSALGTGGLAIGSGAAQFQVAGGVSIANAITISNTAAGGTLGTLGEGLLQATGSGTATLSGPITINGPTTTGNLLGSGATSVLAVTGAITSATTTVGVRTGTVIFSGGGSYAALEVGQGVARLGATNGIAAGAEFRFSNLNNNAGTFDLAGYNQSLSGLVKIGTAPGVNTVGNSSTTSDSTLTTTGTSTFTGVIRDSVSGGTRKVAIVVNGGSLTLSGTNTYTGTTTISAGTLAISGSGGIASSAAVSVASGASFDIAAAAAGVAIGTLSGSGSVVLGGNTLTAGLAANSSFGGVISGSGGFTKAGSGTLSLTSLQTFTGTARVDVGTLAIGGTNTLAAASRIFVAAGATLDASAAGLTVAGNQTLGGLGAVNVGAADLVLAAGASLSPGASVGELDGIGDATFNGGMTYLFEINDAAGAAGASAGWDLFTTTGDLTLAAGFGNRILLDIASLSGTAVGPAAGFNQNSNYAWKFVVAGTPISFNAGWFDVDATAFEARNATNGSFFVARGDQLGSIGATGTDKELYVVYAAVPEPGTLALAGIGLAALGWRLRRRRGRSGRRARARIHHQRERAMRRDGTGAHNPSTPNSRADSSAAVRCRPVGTAA